MLLIYQMRLIILVLYCVKKNIGEIIIFTSRGLGWQVSDFYQTLHTVSKHFCATKFVFLSNSIILLYMQWNYFVFEILRFTYISFIETLTFFKFSHLSRILIFILVWPFLDSNYLSRINIKFFYSYRGPKLVQWKFALLNVSSNLNSFIFYTFEADSNLIF